MPRIAKSRKFVSRRTSEAASMAGQFPDRGWPKRRTTVGSTGRRPGYRTPAMHRALRRPLLAPTTAAALTPAVAAVPAHAAQPGRANLDGSVPSWAQPARDHGAADGAQQTEINVYLPLRDADAAAAMVRDVSDPHSANYGKYLSP